MIHPRTFPRTFLRMFRRMCGRPKQLIIPIKNYVHDDYICEFENDYIFVFFNEVNEKTVVELDDVLEENYMTVHVRTIKWKDNQCQLRQKNRKQLQYQRKLKEDHRSHEA